MGGVFSRNVLIVAIVAAAAGGLVQEIFQTGGGVAYPQWKHDGLYLGSISGLVLGALSGLLTLTILPVGSIINVAFVSQMFFAGMALKGVAEAAGGHAGKNAPDH